MYAVVVNLRYNFQPLAAQVHSLFHSEREYYFHPGTDNWRFVSWPMTICSNYSNGLGEQLSRSKSEVLRRRACHTKSDLVLRWWSILVQRSPVWPGIWSRKGYGVELDG